MRIREWQDILEDVVDRKADPDEWRAIAGTRRNGIGEDMYLAHPSVGVYGFKTYAKNPYDVKGVGAKVARNLDDEIGSYLPDRNGNGRFAIRSPPADEDHAKTMSERLETVMQTHADAPTTPVDLFEDVMDALESPAFGPMEYELSERPEGLDDLTDQFEEAEELMSNELDDLIETDEVDKGFM